MATKDPRTLENLRPGWDGYDGIASTQAAIATAENFCWVPGSDGSIQGEVHAGGADVEICIAPDGRLVHVSFEIQ